MTTRDEGREEQFRRDALAREVATMEARVDALRRVLAGEVPRIEGMDPQHEAFLLSEGGPDYEDTRDLLMLRTGFDGRSPEPQPDERASTAELILRRRAAAPAVGASDAWIEVGDARLRARDPFGHGIEGRVEAPIEDLERAAAGIYPLHSQGVSRCAGVVERAGGYYAVRDARDGRAYAYDDAGDLGRTVCVLARERSAYVGSGCYDSVYAGEVLEVHRIPENRADAFLTAYEDGRLPESRNVREMRRALAPYADLRGIEATLGEMAAEQRAVLVWDVPGIGETLAFDEAGAREVLRADPEYGADAEYVRTARIGYAGVATATEAYAAGHRDGESLRAELLAVRARAQEHAPPTRSVQLETLAVELDGRLSGAQERTVPGEVPGRDDVRHARSAEVSRGEERRTSVLMRGLAALGIQSLSVRPGKAVEYADERLREIESAAAQALVRIVREDPEETPLPPDRAPDRSRAPSRGTSPEGHSMEDDGRGR